MSPSTVLGVVCLAVGLAIGAFGRGLAADAELAALRAQHAEAAARLSQDAQRREAAARAEERRTTLRVMETADAAHFQAAGARRSAAAVAGERDRLRDAYVELAPRLSVGPDAAPVATGGPPASGPGLVLTRLFDGADSLLRSCAAALDQARIAGLACERAYDTVSTPGGP